MNTNQPNLSHFPSFIFTLMVVITVLALHLGVFYWLIHTDFQVVSSYPHTQKILNNSVKAIEIELITLPKDELTEVLLTSVTDSDSNSDTNFDSSLTTTPIIIPTIVKKELLTSNGESSNKTQVNKIQLDTTSDTGLFLPSTSPKNIETVSEKSIQTVVANKANDESSDRLSDKTINVLTNNAINNTEKNSSKTTIKTDTNQAINNSDNLSSNITNNISNNLSNNLSNNTVNENDITGNETITIVKKTQSTLNTQNQHQTQVKKETDSKVEIEPKLIEKRIEDIQILTIETTRTIIKPISKIIKTDKTTEKTIDRISVINQPSETTPSKKELGTNTTQTNLNYKEEPLFSKYYRASKRTVAKVYDGSDSDNIRPIEVGLEISAKQAFEHLLEPLSFDDLSFNAPSFSNETFNNQSLNNQFFNENPNKLSSKKDKLMVSVFCYVDTFGNVMRNPEPFIDRSSGDETIDAKALAVVSTAKFKPFIRNGKAVVVQVEMPLTYTIAHP